MEIIDRAVRLVQDAMGAVAQRIQTLVDKEYVTISGWLVSHPGSPAQRPSASVPVLPQEEGLKVLPNRVAIGPQRKAAQ